MIPHIPNLPELQEKQKINDKIIVKGVGLYDEEEVSRFCLDKLFVFKAVFKLYATKKLTEKECVSFLIDCGFTEKEIKQDYFRLQSGIRQLIQEKKREMER